MAYQITFQNPFGAAVQLEIRTGNQADCERNNIVFNNSLGPNGAHLLETDDNVVCWRRTANPGQPGSPLTQWGTFSPNDANTPTTIQL
jgi:hypothetical protein